MVRLRWPLGRKPVQPDAMSGSAPLGVQKEAKPICKCVLSMQRLSIGADNNMVFCAVSEGRAAVALDGQRLYVGGWSDGRPHGPGVWRCAEHQLMVEARFDRGLPLGPARLLTGDGAAPCVHFGIVSGRRVRPAATHDDRLRCAHAHAGARNLASRMLRDVPVDERNAHFSVLLRGHRRSGVAAG